MTGPVREAQIRARQMGEAIKEAEARGVMKGYRQGVVIGRCQGLFFGLVLWAGWWWFILFRGFTHETTSNVRHVD